MARKFFRTVIKVTVLSEGVPTATGLDLGAISYAITDGDCSGDIEQVEVVELTPKEAAEALIAQHSDPSFFGLDDDGNSEEEEDAGDEDPENATGK